MATHYSILAWRIPGTEEPGGLRLWGCTELDTTDATQQKHQQLAPWKKSYDQPRQQSKKQRHYFANKGASSQSYVFSSSYIWTFELNYKES